MLEQLRSTAPGGAATPEPLRSSAPQRRCTRHPAAPLPAAARRSTTGASCLPGRARRFARWFGQSRGRRPGGAPLRRRGAQAAAGCASPEGEAPTPFVRAPSIGSPRSGMPAMRGASADEQESLRTLARLTSRPGLQAGPWWREPAGAEHRRAVDAKRRPPQRSAAGSAPMACALGLAHVVRTRRACAARARQARRSTAQYTTTERIDSPRFISSKPSLMSLERQPVRDQLVDRRSCRPCTSRRSSARRCGRARRRRPSPSTRGR